jgi:hypothetical protein
MLSSGAIAISSDYYFDFQAGKAASAAWVD